MPGLAIMKQTFGAPKITGAKLVDMGDGTYNVRTEREERHRFGLWHHLEVCCGAVVVDRITSILHFQIVFVSLRCDKS